MTIRKYIQLLFIVLLPAFLSSSCIDKHRTSPQDDAVKYKEPLIRVNKYLFENDIIEINNYCKRKNWTVSVSATGLRYIVYKKGNGPQAEKGQIAVIRFKLSLLDGTLCYSSDSLGLKTFVIGGGTVEKGLDEGILLMHAGDKAHFVLHPGLAWGLFGDEKKIPPHSSIVYDVELISVTNKENNQM